MRTNARKCGERNKGMRYQFEKFDSRNYLTFSEYELVRIKSIIIELFDFNQFKLLIFLFDIQIDLIRQCSI